MIAGLRLGLGDSKKNLEVQTHSSCLLPITTHFRQGSLVTTEGGGEARRRQNFQRSGVSLEGGLSELN